MVSSVDCSFKAVEVSVVNGLDRRIGRSKSHSGVFMRLILLIAIVLSIIILSRVFHCGQKI